MTALTRLITVPAGGIALLTALFFPFAFLPLLAWLGIDPSAMLQVQAILIRFGLMAIVADGALNTIAGVLPQRDPHLYAFDMFTTWVRSIFVVIAVAAVALLWRSGNEAVRNTMALPGALLLLIVALIVAIWDALFIRVLKVHRHFGLEVAEIRREAGDPARGIPTGAEEHEIGDTSVVTRRGRERLLVDRDVVSRTRYWEQLPDGDVVPRDRAPSFVLGHIAFHYREDDPPQQIAAPSAPANPAPPVAPGPTPPPAPPEAPAAA